MKRKTERQAFEAWYRVRGAHYPALVGDAQVKQWLSKFEGTNSYRELHVEKQFRAWQASARRRK